MKRWVSGKARKLTDGDVHTGGASLTAAGDQTPGDSGRDGGGGSSTVGQGSDDSNAAVEVSSGQ